MADVKPILGKVFEDSGATFMARIVGSDGTNVTQSSITSITYKVYDLKQDPPTETGTGTLTISSVIFNTLQTDARWTVDSTGYNFRFEIPASAFNNGNRRFQVEFKITPASGEVFFVVYKVDVLEIYTS